LRFNVGLPSAGLYGLAGLDAASCGCTAAAESAAGANHTVSHHL